MKVKDRKSVVRVTIEHWWEDDMQSERCDYDKISRRSDMELSIEDGELRELFIAALSGMGDIFSLGARKYFSGENCEEFYK